MTDFSATEAVHGDTTVGQHTVVKNVSRHLIFLMKGDSLHQASVIIDVSDPIKQCLKIHRTPVLFSGSFEYVSEVSPSTHSCNAANHSANHSCLVS